MTTTTLAENVAEKERAAVSSRLMMKPEKVQQEVRQAYQTQQQVAMKVFDGVSRLLMNNPSVKSEVKDFQLKTLHDKDPAEVFDNCKVQYAYNQRQKIYSISTNLDSRPRIITVRVGDDFTELSLADKNANVLEMIRQQDGKGITFAKTG